MCRARGVSTQLCQSIAAIPASHNRATPGPRPSGSCSERFRFAARTARTSLQVVQARKSGKPPDQFLQSRLRVRPDVDHRQTSTDRVLESERSGDSRVPRREEANRE